MGAMTTIDAPTDIRTRADEMAEVLAHHARVHDEEGTWVADGYQHLVDEGLLALGVPAEMGGRGATVAEVTDVMRRLAHGCGSTALAMSMHQHVTCFTAWRYRRGLPGAEATLRRIAEEGIVLVSTGGGDFTRPRGEAVAVDGGFRVSGRKRFVSQAPVGTVMSTMVATTRPDGERRVLNMAIPFASEGVTIEPVWDAHGMRGTASEDVVLADVFVPAERVLADRPHGVVDGPLQVIASIAFCIIGGVYLGVAQSAAAAARAALVGSPKADDPVVQRAVGLMETRLRVAGWALDGALAALGDDPTPSMDLFAEVMAAKREVALAGAEVCDLALDVVGGPAFARGSVIERARRDVAGARLHPIGPDATLVHAGRLALGLPCDDV